MKEYIDIFTSNTDNVPEVHYWVKRAGSFDVGDETPLEIEHIVMNEIIINLEYPQRYLESAPSPYLWIEHFKNNWLSMKDVQKAMIDRAFEADETGKLRPIRVRLVKAV